MADDKFAWLLKAACADRPTSDYAVFFPPHSQSANIQEREVCVQCPARRDCLEYAYEYDLEYGYFGGLSPHARSRMTLAEALELVEQGVLQ